MEVPHVVVIGGSFAGTTVCKDLDAALGNRANITLIEKKDALYHTVSSVRAVVEDGWGEKLWIPYTNLFTKNKSGSKVIQASVVSVLSDPSNVTLDNGDIIHYDYLVVTSGCTAPAPGNSDKLYKEDGIKEAQSYVKDIKQAKTVTIVGAGVVGCEIAGEIATDYPHIKVNLISSSSTVIPQDSFRQRTKELLLSQLQDLKVNVILSKRAKRDYKSENGTPTILPGGVGFHSGEFTLKLEDGTEITSDVTICCTGQDKPNSEFMKGLNVTDEKGYIKVHGTGQIEGYPKMFSLGDVSKLEPAKLMYPIAHVSGPLVARNLAKIINAGGPSEKLRLEVYNKLPMPLPINIISLGRNGGVMQTPIGTFGKHVARLIKSPHLFCEKHWKELNVHHEFPSSKTESTSSSYKYLLLLAFIPLVVIGVKKIME